MLAGLQGMLALLAGLAVAGSGMPQPAAGVLVVFCMAWGVWCLLRSRRRHCASERKGLRYQRNTGWELWQPGTGWQPVRVLAGSLVTRDRKSTRLNSSHVRISYAVFCLKKKKNKEKNKKTTIKEDVSQERTKH